jgi:putative transposase
MCKKERPVFRGRAIWLDNKLFKLDAESWKASIMLHGERWVTLRLLHGRYHEKFREMGFSEARLVLREDGSLYLHIIFRQAVVLPEISADAKVIAVDVNENAIVYGNGDFVEKFETNEGIIRTRYFLKRRRIESKTRGRELQRNCWRSIVDGSGIGSGRFTIKVAKKIIDKAKEAGAAIIVMEDLEVYKEDLGSRKLNGRIHRWSYGEFQRMLEYQVKLHGLNVKYVDPRNTSRVCLVCGGELTPSPNRRRLMRCWRCGLEEDRDVIAVRNMMRRYYEECMNAKNPKTSFNAQRQIDVGSPRSP